VIGTVPRTMLLATNRIVPRTNLFVAGNVVRGTVLLGTVLIGTVLIVGAGCTAPDPLPEDAPVTERVCADPALEEEIVALVREGIATKEPNMAFMVARDRTTHFDGSYDWHSCVIGHWVLSVSARVRGDRELDAWLDATLTPEVLAHESELLLAPDPFARVTWPYDEAWFCLLLAERERGADAAREPLRDLRRRHEAHLVAALEVLPFPDAFTFTADPRTLAPDEEPGRRDLAGPYCGFYRSWLWAWLALAWCEPLDPGVRARHAALWDERVAPHLEAIAALEEGHGYDFLWVPALAALGAPIAGDEAPPYALPFDPLAPPPLPDAVVVATVHVLGVHLSRAWPFAAAASAPDATGASAADRAAARAAYRASRDALLARRDLWAESADEGFDASTHWLPQYLFIGEWLSVGRP